MKRGFLLLEVVVAVGLLVVGMAFVSLQLQNSTRARDRAERSMRGRFLAETFLAELDSGKIKPEVAEGEDEGEFGPLFPDWGWRLWIEPGTDDFPELNQLTIDIMHLHRNSIDEPFEHDDAQVVHRLYTLRATPRALNLTTDFGMDDEAADELADKLSTVTEGGLDPRELSPTMFADMTTEELLAAAPALLEAFGLSVSDLAGVLPPELAQALEELEADNTEAEDSDDTGGDSGAETEAGDGDDAGDAVDDASLSPRDVRRGGGKR